MSAVAKTSTLTFVCCAFDVLDKFRIRIMEQFELMVSDHTTAKAWE